MNLMNLKFPRLAVLAGLVSILTSGAFAADKKFQPKTKPYPLATCLVSDEKLGSMGDAHVLTEGNQEIQLCCKSCLKDFQANKEANLKKVAEAWKKVKPYPVATCVVSDEPLDPADAVGVVHADREFFFCCKSCVKEFKKDTAKFVKKFDQLAAKAKP